MGDNPLPEPTIAQFTDAYMHNLASMCWSVFVRVKFQCILHEYFNENKE